MGRADEQYPQSGGGNDTDRADLQLNVADEQQVTANFPTVEEQIEMVTQGRGRKILLLLFLRRDIDSVLLREAAFRTVNTVSTVSFKKNEYRKSNIDFSQKEYGTGSGMHYPRRYAGHAYTMGKALAIEKHGSSANPDLVLSWAKVEKRLRELIKNDRYLNEKERPLRRLSRKRGSSAVRNRHAKENGKAAFHRRKP